MVESTVVEHPALLVMDVQRSIVERIANDPGLLERIGTAITEARAAAIPVIYVGIRFRDGYPEMSPRNRSFAMSRQAGNIMTEGSPAVEIHPAIAPQPGDIVVIKRRVSAFAGSDLDVVLRSQGIDTLILSGIATSGVVLSTLRYAADLDYRLTVLADCCADGDAEVHRVCWKRSFHARRRSSMWRTGALLSKNGNRVR